MLTAVGLNFFDLTFTNQNQNKLKLKSKKKKKKNPLICIFVISSQDLQEGN